MITDAERVARREAKILGPASDAARALRELQRRRENEEDVELVLSGAVWTVQPRDTHSAYLK